MLLQTDGSRHDWLEDHGPRLTRVAAIDDATGIITGATFREQEDAAGYFVVLRQTIRRHGVPLAQGRRARTGTCPAAAALPGSIAAVPEAGCSPSERDRGSSGQSPAGGSSSVQDGGSGRSPDRISAGVLSQRAGSRPAGRRSGQGRGQPVAQRAGLWANRWRSEQGRVQPGAASPRRTGVRCGCG
jgi:hypothetical protein